ncbi:MAG TPA: oligosaccharide flippase family protein [Terriglobales bacterium]|nr:oligosaccharide flippase family protein [Terriglobales bacterium]
MRTGWDEGEAMSGNYFIPVAESENRRAEPNWYAVYLSSQEVFGRGLPSFLIKKEATPTIEDIRATFALQNLLGLSALVVVFMAAGRVARWYGQNQLHFLLAASAIACYGYSLRGVPLALLEREFDYFRVSIIEILENVLFYMTAVPLVCSGHIEAGIASAIILRSWGPTLLCLVFKPVRPAFWFRWIDIGSIADFGFSVAGSSLVNIAVYSVPAIFVGKLSGMYQLGETQMAFALYSNLLFVTAAVVRLNLSVYARLTEHATELTATVNQHLQILAAALTPLIVLFAGFAPLWVPFIFGQKWRELPGLLLAQTPGYLLASVFWGVLNPALLVSRKHRNVLTWLAGFFLVYSVLTRCLSPAWGAMGVAISFSATEIILHPWLFFIYGWKRLEYRSFFPEIVLGAIFTTLLWVCIQRNQAAGFLCATVYLILWLVRNRKILTVASRYFDFTCWYRSAQNLVLPANR